MAKKTGRDVRLELRTSPSPLTYVSYAQIVSMGGIDMTSDEVEATTLDSPGNFKTYIQTLKDAGEMPVRLMFDPNLPTHAGTSTSFYERYRSGISGRHRIVFAPFSPVWYFHFDGYVKGFGFGEISNATAIEVNGVIRISADSIEPQLTDDPDIP